MKLQKIKVLKSFIDKNSNIGYNEGSTFSSDDEERVAFLIGNGYLHAPVKKVDGSLLAEAKELKIKGYTKMSEESLIAAIEAEKAKKASEEDENTTNNATE